jgi:hypothetical protein
MDGTYTTKADEEFFGAIGRLTISWAHIETGIDFIVAVVYHDLGGDEIEEKPWSLARKLKFLRKCFSKFPALEPLREVGFPLFTEIADALEMRQNIIHGFVLDHPEGSGEATMVRLLRGGAPNAHIKFSVTTAEILRAAIEANKLARRALGIGSLMLEARAEVLNKAKQSGGELPS